MRHLLADPLIHFLIIGLAIFGSYNLFVTKVDKPFSDSLVITQLELNLIKKRFKQTWNRVPGDDEYKRLVDDLIYSKALEREALGLGLNQGDEIIRQRLRTKMEFLLNSMTPPFEPSEKDIKAFYDANKESFATPARISFIQLFVGKLFSDKQSTDAKVKELITQLNAGARPQAIKSPAPMARSLKLASIDVVDGTFGPGVFSQLIKLEQGIWSGPVESAYGLHVFNITEKDLGNIFPYSVARKTVHDEMEQIHRAKATVSSKTEIMQKYRVQYPVDNK